MTTTTSVTTSTSTRTTSSRRYLDPPPLYTPPKPPSSPSHIQPNPPPAPEEDPATSSPPSPPTLALAPSSYPPPYAPLDTLATSFILRPPLIYATQTSHTPRYQIAQDFTKSGRPRALHIRRLLPHESRSRSLCTTIFSNSTTRPTSRTSSTFTNSSSSSSTSTLPQCPLPYDPDATMYTITHYDMRGLRSSTLRGSIVLSTSHSLIGKRTTFHHLTKNPARDMLLQENESRMLKYGYHASAEWNRELLFRVRKGRWRDDAGHIVAVEAGENEGEREFRIVEEEIEGQEMGNGSYGVSGPRRDLLVACWMARVWTVEGLRWVGDLGAS